MARESLACQTTDNSTTGSAAQCSQQLVFLAGHFAAQQRSTNPTGNRADITACHQRGPWNAVDARAVISLASDIADNTASRSAGSVI